MEAKIKSKKKKISTQSERITNDIKNAVFNKVFDTLDVNNENKIDGQTISIDMVPDPLKSIMEPLIHEVKEQNETLTGEEFLMACDHVYSVLLYLIVPY